MYQARKERIDLCYARSTRIYFERTLNTEECGRECAHLRKHINCTFELHVSRKRWARTKVRPLQLHIGLRTQFKCFCIQLVAPALRWLEYLKCRPWETSRIKANVTTLHPCTRVLCRSHPSPYFMQHQDRNLTFRIGAVVLSPSAKINRVLSLSGSSCSLRWAR